MSDTSRIAIIGQYKGQSVILRTLDRTRKCTSRRPKTTLSELLQDLYINGIVTPSTENQEVKEALMAHIDKQPLEDDVKYILKLKLINACILGWL